MSEIEAKVHIGQEEKDIAFLEARENDIPPEQAPEYLEYLRLEHEVFNDKKKKNKLLRKVDFHVLFPLTVRYSLYCALVLAR
jgi:hypothetical protein